MNITVFTPTYNRANKLPALYESLRRQTYTDFQWLIVDDGSTDNTEQVVGAWINESIIKIKYYKQPNGGKMRAHNTGAKLCDTKYFVCVDSDDYLTDDAIEVMERAIPEVDGDNSKIGLLLRKYLTDEDNKYYDCGSRFITLHDLYASGFCGETTLLFKTSILRKYPFPVIDGEKFVTEGSAYDLIDQNYKYLFISKAVTICEYNPDGYTLNLLRLYRNNPCGYVNYYYQAWQLYGNKVAKQHAYMFTFFIKDRKTRKEYRNKDFDIRTKIFGYLRYLKKIYITKR